MEAKPTPSRCVRAVMSQPMLFDMIFANIGMKDLLTRAARVCKEWKAAIDGSALLQKILFFQPDHRPRKLDILKCPFDGVKFDNVTTNHPESCFYCKATADDKELAGYPACLANPLLSNKHEKNIEWHELVLPSGFDGSSQWEEMKGIKNSWRRMYATQPPVTKVIVKQAKKIHRLLSGKCRLRLPGCQDGSDLSGMAERADQCPESLASGKSGA